jgi:hypothetical protein
MITPEKLDREFDDNTKDFVKVSITISLTRLFNWLRSLTKKGI